MKHLLVSKLILMMLFCAVSLHCSAQYLQKAFDEISAIEGFTQISVTCEEYGFPKEFGEMQVSCFKNSSPRDKVLKILERVPQSLLAYEFIDERNKIDRIYIEQAPSGKSFMMQIRIGLGGNDLCPILVSGGELKDYENVVKKMKSM